MMCSYILTLTFVMSDGSTRSAQKHFNHATLEQFEKTLNTSDNLKRDLNLPDGVVSIDDIGGIVTAKKPFPCGSKPEL